MFKTALQSFLAKSAGVSTSASKSSSQASAVKLTQASAKAKADASLEAAERIMKMSLMKSKRDVKDAASTETHTLSNAVCVMMFFEQFGVCVMLFLSNAVCVMMFLSNAVFVMMMF
jgi:hypothetical protein